MSRPSFQQVKNLGGTDEFRARLDELGIDLPFADPVDPSAGLARMVKATTLAGGPSLEIPNRFAILPMEGWDGDADGRPTELVRRRWERFGQSGAGLVWGEATAVRSDGRANPNQLVLDESTVSGFAELRSLLAPEQVVGLQLTHSGRWSRLATGPNPRVVYRHPYLDERLGIEDAHVLSDVELHALAVDFVRAARLAAEAGFDFVDVKACHGYLLHEMLTAHDRLGPHGGTLENRSRFMLGVIREIRRELPELSIACRLSVTDLKPHVPGPEATGIPADDWSYRFAFGGDDTGLGVDLTEPHALLGALTDAGVSLVSTTIGSPYYCPHAQRPAFFPPSDGYQPPEDPLVRVADHLRVTAEITERHPHLTTVGSGYTYLQDWLPNVAAAAVEQGGTDLVGLGRMALSYPTLPADVLAGSPLDRRLVCRTFSDCTTAPRHGLVSGCFPLDPFYKQHEHRVSLAAAKKESRARMRPGGGE